MKIALYDVDSHHFPNLPLMKLSAWHKAQGDTVEWWSESGAYDSAYLSKVFDKTYTPDVQTPKNAAEIVKGGTGYGLGKCLPDEIEHIYPDYALYSELTRDTAYGFLTRGCPRRCSFCLVSEKEGRQAKKVADLSEFWDGQKYIKLLDPNLLACPEHPALLEQLAASGAYVDFTQGLDARLLTTDNIDALNHVKKSNIHFAWDYMDESEEVLKGLRLYAKQANRKLHGNYGTVYCLTNFGTTMEENLYRIETLDRMGYNPYVMIYDKPHAPRELRQLQRWCNSIRIRKTVPKFEDYKGGIKKCNTS